MPSKKKSPGGRSGEGKGKALMEQMGMFPDLMIGGGMDVDDDDLEAELLALQGGAEPSASKKKHAKIVNLSELDKLVADSLKVIPSDEELSDDDDDLMAELMEIAKEEPAVSSPTTPTASVGSGSGSQKQVALLKERLDMYTLAESNAKSKGDNTKARRMNRGVKTIQDLLKKAEAGQHISEDDIPPPVASGSSKPVSQNTTPENERMPSTLTESIDWPPVQPSGQQQTEVLWTPGQQPPPVPAPRQVATPSQQQGLLPTEIQAIPPQPVSGGFILGEFSELSPGFSAHDPYTGYNIFPAPTLNQAAVIPPIRQDSPTSLASNASVPTSRSSPPQTVSEQTSPQLSKADSANHRIMVERRDQYKVAALKAKRNGDNATAMKFIKIAKKFEQVIAALEKGDPVDLSEMPPPPPDITASETNLASKTSVPKNTEEALQQRLQKYKSSQVEAQQQGDSSKAVQMESNVNPPVQPTERSSMQASSGATSDEIEVPELSTEEKKKLFNAPETASSTEEALQQRLQKYKATQAESQQQGNSSKARRMGRIVKQYEDAIKAYKAGKPVDFDDLPCPPGFPPIPKPTSKAAVSKPASSTPAAGTSSVASSVASPASNIPAQGSTGTKYNAPPPPPTTQKTKMQRQLSTMSRAEQQTIFLQERQLQFRKAALNAKKNGDMELAKKYLRQAKGFDQMIEASTAGLPVDTTQIPPPPHSQKDDDFEFVEAGDITGDREEMYKKLEQELIQQIRTCSANADSFTHLGDVSTATKFDKLGQNCRKDLDALRNAYKHGDPVPRFHYENRQFSIVKCCTDLGDNDLEIVILRGLNYGLPSGYQPKDLDTYVKFEFPFPTDDPQCGQTDTQKHTTSPEYNQSFKLQINRKSRVFQRLLKSSKTLKYEVYYKRGFLKGDKVLGTVNFKLQALEDDCEVHECANLMDGRKACGGKLEFKIRIREPIINKHVEEVKEKWVVIDRFEYNLKQQNQPQIRQKPVSSKPVPQPRQAAPQPKQTPLPLKDYSSMEVLKFEKQQIETQIRRYQGRLTKAEEESLYHKVELITRKIEEIKSKLQAGGSAAWKEYANAIEKAKNTYVQEAKMLAQQGSKDKAVIAMQKKKLIEKEVEAIRVKLPAHLK